MDEKDTSEIIKEKNADVTEKQGVEKTCREVLRSGGELVICGSDVRIEYFFPGPDRRYGGSRVVVQGRNIPEYIAAFRENWNAYLDAKKTSGRQLVNIMGNKGMLIKNGVMGGVYLKPGQMRIYSEEQLCQIINDYEYCYTRYREIRDC